MISIRMLFLYLVMGFILLLPILFFLTTQEVFPRKTIEGLSILLSMIILLIYPRDILRFFFVISLIMLAFLSRLIFSGSVDVAIYDLAGVPLLIYFSGFRIPVRILHFSISFLIILEFCGAIWAYSNHIFVDYFRIGGFFPSSMHLGFASAGLAFAVFLSRIKFKTTHYSMLLVSAIFSGSRAGLLAVTLLAGYTLIEKLGQKILFLIPFFGLIFWFNFGSYRAISYVAESDSVRISGYLSWLERLDFQTLLFGEGRFFLGSVGVHNNPTTSLITESSILTYLEAYGFFIGSIFLIAPLFKKIINIRNPKYLFFLFLFFTLAMIGPFLETPSLLFSNSLLIMSSLNALAIGAPSPLLAHRKKFL